MSNTRSIAEKPGDFAQITPQSTSREIWRQQHCLRTGNGRHVDGDTEASYHRVATA